MGKDRKELEAEFHDQREIDRRILSNEEFIEKYPNKGFYRSAGLSKSFLENWIKENCNDKNVLDYCCGLGETSVLVAKHGGYVTGIDISENEINSALKLYKDTKNVKGTCKFIIQDAENTDFEDKSFDVIVCNGVLHHLDLDKAYMELSRLLNDSGQIIAIEALKHNPFIHFYRKKTPHLRTAWEVDHILTVPKIKLGRKYFKDLKIHYFHLFNLPSIFISNKILFDIMLVIGNFLDKIFLKIPYINRWAWTAIFIYKK
jgi:ubiquinone/menaquinone biosynthesis C-methylase UbiE